LEWVNLAPNLVRRSNKPLNFVGGAALLNHLTTVRWQEEFISFFMFMVPCILKIV